MPRIEDVRKERRRSLVNLPYDFGKKSEERILVGGVGSGTWYRFNTKSTISECQSIDVRYLQRNGLLGPGHSFSLQWSRAGRQTGSIGGVVYDDRVTFFYRHRRGPGGEWEDVRETVPLTRTACNFGGERPWFICPGAGCGRRVALLYGPGRYFLCRHCYDLTYDSQRENKMYRALHRAQDIRRRLGGSANMMEPFPEKPKGMHWSTYDRLWWEHHEAEMEQPSSMREWIDKLEKEVV
jgi:hypothetical protein